MHEYHTDSPGVREALRSMTKTGVLNEAEAGQCLGIATQLALPVPGG